MVVVGSAALDLFGLSRSEPKDLDVWLAAGEEYKGKADIHVLPQYILDLVETDGCFDTATPDSVYTIKCSHLAWDIHWAKTKADVLWLKAKGCQIQPELYAELKKHWEAEHGDKSFLSLSKGKEQFFDDAVKYVYDHDYLHELVAYPEKPMYTRCLKEGEAVLIDKERFFLMSFTDQVRMFKEEIAVIAFERWMVHHKEVSWFEAYSLSLKKTITNLTKNWATDFIVFNLQHFTTPDYTLFEHLLKTLQPEGLVMKDVQEFFAAQAALQNQKPQEFLEGIINDEAFWPVGFEGGFTEKRAESDRLAEAAGYKSLDEDGGGEGGSEDCYKVFALGGKTLHVSFSYYSYDGYDTDYALDTLKEVKPVEKTVTVYE